MHAEELVTYTFAALQAWAQGRGQGRLPDQTPLEFARNLGAEASSMRDQLTTVGRLYTKVAYAGYRPNLDDMASLAAFWTALEQSDAVPSVAAG